MNRDDEPRISAACIVLMGAGVLMLMSALSAWAWLVLPEDVPIPVHWNASGEVDRYGGRIEGLLGLPLVTAGLILLLAVLPRIEPRRANIMRSGRAYMAVSFSVLMVMLAVHAIIVLGALGYAVDVGSAVLTVIGLMLMVLGNYLGKIRSNFFFGIRTPWTLSSELSWNKTHRLGGKLFMGLGVLTLLGTLFFGRSSVWLTVMVAGVVCVALFLVAYSWLVFKQDSRGGANG